MAYFLQFLVKQFEGFPKCKEDKFIQISRVLCSILSPPCSTLYPWKLTSIYIYIYIYIYNRSHRTWTISISENIIFLTYPNRSQPFQTDTIRWFHGSFQQGITRAACLFWFSPRQWKDHPFHPDSADAGAQVQEKCERKRRRVAILELNMNTKSSIEEEYT